MPRHHHLRRLRSLVAADDDDLLEVRHLVARFQSFGELGGVLDDERTGFRVVHHVRNQIGRVAWINRHGDAAGAEDRKVHLDPFGAAGREQRDAISLFATERNHAEGELTDALAQFARGQRHPRAVMLELLCRAGAPLFHAGPKHACERVCGHVVLPQSARFTSPADRGFGVALRKLAVDKGF